MSQNQPDEVIIENGFYTADVIKIDARLDIYIYGEIKDIENSHTVELINLIEMAECPIFVTISSYGGSMYTSFAIYNALKSKQPKFPVITIANGIVASGAAIIFMAGSDRWAYDYTTFMIHGLQMEGFYSGSMKNLELDMTFSNSMYKRFIRTVFKDNFTEAEISDICDKSLNKYFDTYEAVQKGIVNNIIIGEEESEEGDDE